MKNKKIGLFAIIALVFLGSLSSCGTQTQGKKHHKKCGSCPKFSQNIGDKLTNCYT